MSSEQVPSDAHLTLIIREEISRWNPHDDTATDKEVEEFIQFFNKHWRMQDERYVWTLQQFKDQSAPHRHPGSIIAAYLEDPNDHRSFIYAVDPKGNLHTQTWNLYMRMAHAMKMMDAAERGGREQAVEHALNKLRQILK